MLNFFHLPIIAAHYGIAFLSIHCHMAMSFAASSPCPIVPFPESQKSMKIKHAWVTRLARRVCKRSGGISLADWPAAFILADWQLKSGQRINGARKALILGGFSGGMQMNTIFRKLKMVVNSVLPNLLNVAQIVNIVTGPVNGGFPSTVESVGTNFIVEYPPIAQNGMMPTVEPGLQRECTPKHMAAQSGEILTKILRPDLYDKHLTPDPQGVNVSIELALQTFYDVSETSASFTADVLMSQIWHDRRLRYAHLGSCIENLTLSSAIVDRLWQPFVCFVNSKKSELHISPSPNTFVLIYPNGTVWMNYRLRVEGPCYVDLTLYPFNEEECELVLESYAYNTANVRLMWRAWNPVFEYPSRTKPPDFLLSEIRWAKHSFVYAAGKWDQLTVNFFLTRQFGVYLFQMYFPVQTAVAMSWIPFFLDHRSLPARITLSVSALMSITFQYGNILKSLPRVSYVMSVDVWIFGSIAFIASSLIELAIVGHLHRQNRSRRSARRPTVFLEQEQGMFQNSTGTSAPATPGLEHSFAVDRDDHERVSDRELRRHQSVRYHNQQAYGTFFASDISPEDILEEPLANGRTNSNQNHNQQQPQQQNNRRMSGGNLLHRKKKKFGKFMRQGTQRIKDSIHVHIYRLTNFEDKNWTDPLYWDERARIYFPLSYFLFNVAYWAYYVGFHRVLRPWLYAPPFSADA